MKFSRRRNFCKIAVRFCWFDGNFIRVKLEPGHRVMLNTYVATDEGWRRDLVVFSLQGRAIQKDWVNDERDCDGRLTRYGRSICPVSARAKISSPGWGVEKRSRARLPSWGVVYSHQRDEYAERMGY